MSTGTHNLVLTMFTLDQGAGVTKKTPMENLTTATVNCGSPQSRKDYHENQKESVELVHKEGVLFPVVGIIVAYQNVL